MGLFYILLASFLWAVDTLIRYPLIFGGVSAEKIVLSEHLLLVLIFTPMLIKSRKIFWEAKISQIFSFLVIGGLGSAVATLAFTKAFGLINPSLVILLQKLQPLVAIFWARALLKEPLQKNFLIWATFCLAGGMLISYPDLVGGLSGLKWGPHLWQHKMLMGYGLTLLAVFSWGSATVFGKKLVQSGFREPEVMAGRFFFGLVFLLPLLFSGQVRLNPTEIDLWGKIALMVILSGWLGMYFYYKGLNLIPARLCALAEMFFPLCAVCINWLVLGATLTPLQIFGGALLLLGSTVIQFKRY